MKERLIIIGARALGRETCVYARDAGLDIKGFLDSNAAVLDDFPGYPPVLGSAEAYDPREEDRFVVALGDPACKLRYAEMIAAKGGRFASVVHPAAWIGANVVIGEGAIICPRAVLTCDIRLGRHVTVNVGAVVNHDTRIGDGASVCAGCTLAGRVEVGRGVYLGAGATLASDIGIGDGVHIAVGATVTDSLP